MQILDNGDVKICYSNTGINLCIPASIKFNERSDYRDRIDLGVYCKPEYKLDGKLDINYYDSY